jgi:hypothetical protein
MPRRNSNAPKTPARRAHPAAGGTKLDQGGRPVTDDGGRPVQLDSDGPKPKGRRTPTKRATQVPEGWTRRGAK